MLGECSRVDGQISPDNQSRLRSILSNQFGITANATSVILEIKMDEPITKKVEQVEVYREIRLSRICLGKNSFNRRYSK